MKNLGVNRKFRPEAYQMNDGLGKKVILTYLKGKGHIILDTRENYSFDIANTNY